MIPLAAIMSIGEKVLDKVLPDPEAKARAMAELTKIQNEGKLAELNACFVLECPHQASFIRHYTSDIQHPLHDLSSKSGAKSLYFTSNAIEQC